jgi:hypothetical protein
MFETTLSFRIPIRLERIDLCQNRGEVPKLLPLAIRHRRAAKPRKIAMGTSLPLAKRAAGQS